MGVPSELVERRLWSELEERPDVFAARLIDLPPADVVDILNRLRLADAAAVLDALPISRAIEVFDQPTLRRRGALLEHLTVERGAQILTGLSADERTDVAREMGAHGCRRLLPKLPADARAEVERLLRYPDHSAGGIMTTEFVRLDPSMTVGQGLKRIAQRARRPSACRWRTSRRRVSTLSSSTRSNIAPHGDDMPVMRDWTSE